MTGTPSNILEICCYCFESCLHAEKAGADRIELCEGPEWGGISPSTRLLDQVFQVIKTPIMVMLRPRGGNFHYNPHEIHEMKNKIRELKAFPIQGMVLGTLLEDHRLDWDLCKRLQEWIDPLPITFHKAFDEILDPEASLEMLMELGIARILTSGQKPNAWEGRELIQKLKIQAGNQLEIMAGGGIRSTNLERLWNFLGSGAYHSSAILNEEFPEADFLEIKRLKSLLNSGLTP